MPKKAFDNQKVVLGLSGGVDSTTAALLLTSKGYSVTGLFLDVTGKNQEGRTAAEKAARDLGLDFLYRNVSESFQKEVIADFCAEYLSGRTPSPCIRCNPAVKFRALEAAADELGAGGIATGHYARVFRDNTSGRFFATKGISREKDQSYMLYRLPQSVLSRLLLPLGEMPHKETVREIAREKGLSNADLADSQEICFIPAGMHYAEYLKSCGLDSRPGDFTDPDGNVLGQHQGIVHYTVGQRKGLGVAFGKPMFVTGVDPKKNRVILGTPEDLFSQTVISEDNWFAETDSGEIPDYYEGMEISAKIRYTAKDAAARLYREDGGLVRVVFAEAQRAATPGQSVVFYDEDRVLGGGLIRRKESR